jgi:hypothetical protein
MGTVVKSLYDTDFVEWTASTADLLRAGRLDEVDLEQVAEEIEDLGKRDRDAVRSQMLRMLKHLIKQRFQPERDGASWQTSIGDARGEIWVKMESSPGLRNHLGDSIERIYARAVKDAVREMGLTRSAAAEIPQVCPYSLAELLGEDDE